MSDHVRTQLSALDRVARSFERDGIEYWLFGGWAVDFHAGAVTRPHDDLDIAVRMEDWPRISRLLESDGWKHAPEPDEDGGTGYERGGVRLELTYLVRAGDETVRTPLAAGDAAWPDGSFGADDLELLGVRSRVIALAALACGKSASRENPAEAAKDSADYVILRRLVER